MEFKETPTQASRRLRFRSQGTEKGAEATNGSLKPTDAYEAGADSPSPLTSAGEAFATIYVAAARAVLLGVEAIQDRRA